MPVPIFVPVPAASTASRRRTRRMSCRGPPVVDLMPVAGAVRFDRLQDRVKRKSRTRQSRRSDRNSTFTCKNATQPDLASGPPYGQQQPKPSQTVSLLSEFWWGTTCIGRVMFDAFVGFRLPFVGMGEVGHKTDISDLIRPADAAKQLGVSVRTLARWEAAGRLKAVLTAGGHRRYRSADIDAIA